MAAAHAVLNVPSVSCNHCKMAIEGAVAGLAGVDGVLVDVADKTVTIDFEDGAVTLETIEQKVTDEGYAVAGHHVFDA